MSTLVATRAFSATEIATTRSAAKKVCRVWLRRPPKRSCQVLFTAIESTVNANKWSAEHHRFPLIIIIPSHRLQHSKILRAFSVPVCMSGAHLPSQWKRSTARSTPVRTATSTRMATRVFFATTNATTAGVATKVRTAYTTK